ncbi:MAG: methylenetetrahydrofolate reductase [Phycisphaerales bacterium]|nr:methylenetetrahydrofolate reductase [Phycisphaerales bacterium]
MKIIERIRQSKKTLLSLEVLPPLKGKSIQSLFNSLDVFKDFKPSWINVTNHRPDIVKRPVGILGRTRNIEIRKRPATIGVCAALMNRYQIDAVPHIICAGTTVHDIEDTLIELNFLGIDNVLALRGDLAKNESCFTPKLDGHRYALELVKQIQLLNDGHFIDEGFEIDHNMNFCVGVAGYPEKHFESYDQEEDISFVKEKVKAGADYIVTQLFFDNKYYFDFVARCRNAGVTVPIIPGLKPLTTKNQLRILPKTFHITIPKDLVHAVESCNTDIAVEQVGVEWLTQQSKDLQQSGVPALHYYTMGKSNAVEKVLKIIF